MKRLLRPTPLKLSLLALLTLFGTSPRPALAERPGGQCRRRRPHRRHDRLRRQRRRAVLHKDEWIRCDRTYTQRVTDLVNGGGLNGSVLLNDQTVHDDGACDRLTGSAGRDWFFANLDCGVRDVVTDDHNNEYTNDID
jgi:hypothetical protein